MQKDFKNIGEFIRTKRLKLGLSLRKFCFSNNLDPAYVSRLERGHLIPTKTETLENIASALGIEESSKEWQLFFDLAYTTRGEFPNDLKDNPAFLKSLPVFFRTIRGSKPTKEDLEKLIKVLKDA